MASLPSSRGETSDALLAELTRPVHALPAIAVPHADDPLSDEDLQLSLYLLYELHYRGLPGVDERWEWEPTLLELRRRLEDAFELALPESGEAPAADEMDRALRALAEDDSGPSLSQRVEREASVEQLLEFLVHRSAYQLKEADPHSWALPRLHGPPKAALVEIQADEYGGGRPERVHAAMFAESLAAVGLDPEYGAYLSHIPGVTLATVNLMSLFGLHRRLRGAIVGHLALFEMTSSIPNRRYAAAVRRHGFGDQAAAFFDEHVLADAVHENIAAVDLAGGLARQEPALAAQILWGARCLDLLDGRWAAHVMRAWDEGESSLYAPLGEPAAAV